MSVMNLIVLYYKPLLLFDSMVRVSSVSKEKVDDKAINFIFFCAFIRLPTNGFCNASKLHLLRH